jgi:uncharacterized protein (TIGR00730 family)
MRISVFGGSAPKPQEPAYQEAYKLGQLIAEAGHTVLTGGYIGTMEAVSRGAAEAGGHVIGVTCDEIESWRPVGPNPWIKEEIRLPTLQDRVEKLIKSCDAAFALPGGVGTLAEIAVMWSLIQTQVITIRPLILIGPGWEKTFTLLYDAHASYIPPAHRHLISFAPDVNDAFSQLSRLPDS